VDILIGTVARELASLEERLDRALEQAFGSSLQLPRRLDSFRPALDVYESRDATIVRVDLAGVETGDIRLTVDGEFLQVSGRRASQYDPPAQHHIQMEISQGPFDRVLRLGKPYDPEKVTAVLAGGILTIQLPHRASGSRRIPVDRS